MGANATMTDLARTNQEAHEYRMKSGDMQLVIGELSSRVYGPEAREWLQNYWADMAPQEIANELSSPATHMIEPRPRIWLIIIANASDIIPDEAIPLVHKSVWRTKVRKVRKNRILGETTIREEVRAKRTASNINDTLIAKEALDAIL